MPDNESQGLASGPRFGEMNFAFFGSMTSESCLDGWWPLALRA